MLKLITNERGETIDPAEQQARLDLASDQPAPNDPLPFDLGAEIAMQNAAHRALYPALYGHGFVSAAGRGRFEPNVCEECGVSKADHGRGGK